MSNKDGIYDSCLFLERGRNLADPDDDGTQLIVVTEEDLLQYLNESAKKKKELVKEPLTSKEREEVNTRFSSIKIECSFAKNGDGKYFCYTHRARSKFYDTIGAIPISVVKFINSTG